MNLKLLLTNIFKKKAVEEDKEEIEPVEEIIEKPVWKGLASEERWKFSEMEKQTVISWYAMGFSPSEVIEKAKEELNIKISASQISNYSTKEKWKPLIKKIREATMNDLASVSGSHKKVRLQRHEKIYDKAIVRNKFDLALRATEAQRKEMEEGQVNLTLNQFNILSDDELKEKHNEVLNRIKLLSQHNQNKGVIDVVSADKTETA